MDADQRLAARANSTCNDPTEFMKTHLTMDTLAPIYNDGLPQYGLCRYTYGTFWEFSIAEAGRDAVIKYWPFTSAPSIRNAWSGHVKFGPEEDTPEYDWTCSGLDQIEYLRAVVNVTQKLGTPDVIRENIGSSVATASLRASLGEATSVTLKCVNGSSLSHVITCWSKAPFSNSDWDHPDYSPIDRIDCPASVLAQDTCTDANVAIRSYGA